ncbi:MAG: biotin transporter BioY [Sphaerochaetaceae bacterium]
MQLRSLIITALFAALIVAGSYIAIPLGPVPLTLQTLFVLLAGILGGKVIGLTAVAIYLVLGAFGLPVFSGGSGGFAHFFAPTGGFLIALLVVGPTVGAIVDHAFKGAKATGKKQLLYIILAATVGTLLMFAIGVPYLKVVLKLSWPQALAVGLFPFIPGDLVKLVATVLLGNIFALQIRQFVTGDESDTTTDG